MHVVEAGLHRSLLHVSSCNRHGWNVGKPTYTKLMYMHGDILMMVTVSRNADSLIAAPVTMFCVFLCCHSHNTVHACLSDLACVHVHMGTCVLHIFHQFSHFYPQLLHFIEVTWPIMVHTVCTYVCTYIRSPPTGTCGCLTCVPPLT